MSDFDDKTIDGGLALPAPVAAPIIDAPDTSEAAGMAALVSAFGGGEATVAAQAILREAPTRVLEIAGERTHTRKGRLAFLDWTGDDSSSMFPDPAYGRNTDFFRILMNGYDFMIKMLRDEIAHDSVATFVAAGLLNQGTIHGYTPLDKVPSLANHTAHGGGTLWMKRFGEQLAALAIKVGQTDELGREATGVAFLGTDGWDTEMYRLQDDFPEWKYGKLWREKLSERFHNLQQVTKGFVTQGNISTAVAFMGKLVKPGDEDYELEMNGIKGARESVGLANPKNTSQEDLIQDMFRELGFPEDMIFLPGADMRRLAEVLAAVSRSMVQRSRGAKPDGNKGISWKRH